MPSVGGPNFRFPFTKESFVADRRLDELASVTLVGTSDELLAFGQFYCRDARCHLCSLFVLHANRPAVNCDRRVGFVAAIYPGGELPIEGRVYMVAQRQSMSGLVVMEREGAGI